MSLYDLAPSDTISASQLRLALITRKTEIQRINRLFPHVFEPKHFESMVEEIDRFLLFIDGSKEIKAVRNDKDNTSFTISELQGAVNDLPEDGYFRQEGNVLYYYFICNDMKIVERKYELLDMFLNGEWISPAAVDQPENLNLVGQEIRFIVFA